MQYSWNTTSTPSRASCEARWEKSIGTHPINTFRYGVPLSSISRLQVSICVLSTAHCTYFYSPPHNNMKYCPKTSSITTSAILRRSMFDINPCSRYTMRQRYEKAAVQRKYDSNENQRVDRSSIQNTDNSPSSPE